MRRYTIYGVYIIIGILVVSAIAFKDFQPVQVVPRIRLAPAFSLVTQDGASLTNEDLRGQFVLYNFLYTNCPEPCNGLNRTMREINTRLDEINLGGIPVKFVSIFLI